LSNLKPDEIVAKDYAEFLLLNLLAEKDNDARFLWKRIPVISLIFRLDTNRINFSMKPG